MPGVHEACRHRFRRPTLTGSRLTAVLLVLILGQTLSAEDDSFEKQVRPLLIKRCYACHGGTKSGGGLSLETAEGWRRGGESGPAIVPGKPAESLLVEAISYRNLEMPPRDAGGKLPDEEIAILTRWIARGAPDPRGPSQRLGGMSLEQAKSWWAFQPLPSVTSPATAERIDQFVQAALDERGLPAARPADKRTLIRRATYDLTGLPPTAEEVDAFLADDAPDAFERLIDRLLDSPQYGVHWGRHWLDVVRYADTAGENTDRPLPHAWRYRNWVFEAFNRDLPYDEFVRRQISGDILAAAEPARQRVEGIVATGYLAVARRFGHDIDKDLHLTYEDVIDNLGKNFLGLSLGCARCHDHKYDPVTAADYYALYGIFSSTRFAFPGCEAKGQPRDLVPLLDQAEADVLLADYQRRLADYERRMEVYPREAQRLKRLAADARRVLVESAVGEGQSVSLHEGSLHEGSLHEGRAGALARLALRRGEVLQLVVGPNGGHGADTTLVNWQIVQTDGQPTARWEVKDLIPGFTQRGPLLHVRNAAWCLLDVTDGPMYLRERKRQVAGQPALSAWSLGDTPSVVVNAADEPVAVWTTLPAQSVFMHPGIMRDVAVAWICPADGQYEVRGAVADAHPSGGDGVTLRLEHVAAAEYGQGLLELGKLVTGEQTPRPEAPEIPVAYAVSEAEVKEARLQLRGDPEQPGDVVPRRWLSVFGGAVVAADGSSGRRELAEWIVDQPLLARVMANRVWQWHFGRGLVATPNDFGSRGEPPSHPELLDWLAARFQAGGYRLKPLHRLIMTSAAYQRASESLGPQAEADPDGRWLGSFRRRRLTAEEIRDSLLAAGGTLDVSWGQAHPFPPESGWNFTQHNPFAAVYESNRRSAFLMVQRQRRHPYLALFDGADPNSSTGLRQATIVPTQALYFMNDPFVHQQAASLADALVAQTDDASRLRLAFQRLFQRAPTAGEEQLAERFLAAYPGAMHEKWSAYARVLFSSNEFLYVD
ncbi:MAG: PSD1 domain-containing protein [Pirellulaceae bacterium]|nr:PSD1 domain-containing protein [Pirellulaceae bacterium]